MNMARINLWTVALGALAVVLLAATPAAADQCFVDDVIVDGSINVGFDSICNRNFGFDTLVLSENNLRIFFEDTSNSASFPTNDWRIVINDTTNGGANYFGIEDSSAGRQPFRIEAGARSSALYVESDGDVGIGTSNPVLELHVVRGDSPGLRLEQDGSSGFTPQTWDLVGNEASFFIRDATNGSKLPFRIRPNAPSSSIDIAATGRVGIGTGSPAQALHVRRTDGSARLQVEEASGTTANRTLIQMQNNGSSNLSFFNTGNSAIWLLATATVGADDVFRISRQGTGVNELELDASGNLMVTGNIDSGGTTTVPDYVFKPDYSLMPIADLAAFVEREQHLPRIPSADDIARRGSVNMTEMQMLLLEKVEELTLYTISQQRTIDELHEANRTLNERLTKLEPRAQQ